MLKDDLFVNNLILDVYYFGMCDNIEESKHLHFSTSDEFKPMRDALSRNMFEKYGIKKMCMW